MEFEPNYKVMKTDRPPKFLSAKKIQFLKTQKEAQADKEEHEEET